MKNEVTLRNCEDIIDYLLSHPFHSLSYDDKLFVKSLKQPQPNLTGLICVSGKQKRSFNTTWYQKCTWLVGSVNKNLLFCWPCLLFAAEAENTVWSRLGFNDLVATSIDAPQHVRVDTRGSQTEGIKDVASLRLALAPINFNHGTTNHAVHNFVIHPFIVIFCYRYLLLLLH
jgi:hypothetical protein